MILRFIFESTLRFFTLIKVSPPRYDFLRLSEQDDAEGTKYTKSMHENRTEARIPRFSDGKSFVACVVPIRFSFRIGIAL